MCCRRWLVFDLFVNQLLKLTSHVGMGGLSTALSLAKEGFKDISVYESASDLGFVGAGIQLAPNMARILSRLGVWEDVARNATELKEISIRGTSGCCLIRTN